MVTINIEFSELLKAVEQLSDEQKHILQQHMNTATQTEPKSPKKRTAGLGEGTIWISDDFDDPLPDEFWLGEDE